MNHTQNHLDEFSMSYLWPPLSHRKKHADCNPIKVDQNCKHNQSVSTNPVHGVANVAAVLIAIWSITSSY